uniref:NADH-ubiquinone oxidoreductase chain 6 n=1 Tax=Strahlaxius plectrorhynchus TaxID=2302681 RepID=A0A4Y5QJJ8_9EUCA|nr:NADH dehydrogenase subunit 6 [Strahlaxius plectrorhynchus]QCX31788.1 NADH dehydrogenase subunit 6 [Strahlaxius plectrorhynchus]
MLSFLFIFSGAMSLMFTRLNHPLSMGIVLLLQTCMVCIASGLVGNSFWFSYILFLVFLGGMLVLFIYVASLASNESFKLSLKMFLSFIPIISSAMIIYMLDSLLETLKFSFLGPYTEFMMNMETLVSKIYSVPSMGFTMYVVMYLLLTLFVVVEITGTFWGPLRLSTYDDTNT